MPVPPGSDMEQAIATGAPVRVELHAEGSPVSALGYRSSIVAPIKVGGAHLGADGGRHRAGRAGSPPTTSAISTRSSSCWRPRSPASRTGPSSPPRRPPIRSPAWPTTESCTSACAPRWPAPAATASRCRWRCSTSTTSSSSTTSPATPPATGCSSRSPTACASSPGPRTRSGGSAATSSPGCCRAARASRHWPPWSGPAGGWPPRCSEPFRVTISAGICDTRLTDDASELIRLADGALYWSKAHGRDQCWIYDPEVVEELSAQERAERLARSQALIGLRALARAIDAKDPATREHSERVSLLAGRLAIVSGWSSEQALQAQRGRARARRRQDRHPGPDAAQGESAHRRRADADPRPRRARGPDRRGGAQRRAGGLDPHAPRTARRHRVSARAPRGGDPRGRVPARARRCLGRDDGQPPVQRAEVDRRGARGVRRADRPAVLPDRGRRPADAPPGRSARSRSRAAEALLGA